MDKSRKARIIKGLLTIGATGIMCDACGGELTGCIYDSIKTGEPITVGQVITLPDLPVMAQSVITFGGL